MPNFKSATATASTDMNNIDDTTVKYLEDDFDLTEYNFQFKRGHKPSPKKGVIYWALYFVIVVVSFVAAYILYSVLSYYINIYFSK